MRSRFGLEQAEFGEARHLRASDNQVIENSDIDERERLAQTARNEFVRPRWRGLATRVLGFISGCHRYLCPSVPSPTVPHT